MKGEKGILESYTGNDSEVIVSFSADGQPVTEIGAKAFLSCKSAEKLVIGDTVFKIGDWAFAHMKNLKILELPCREISLGRKVFLDCEKLMQIQIRNDKSENPGTPFFMASAVRLLKKEDLCRPDQAGAKASHREWIREYDEALLHFIQEEDKDGFEPVFIGWFHVEDTDEQIPRYLKLRRSEKTELVFQRLLYPLYLEKMHRTLLYRYLREHMPNGCRKEEHTEVFTMLCDPDREYGRDIRYMKIMEEAGGLSFQNVQKLLDHMEGCSAEVTAFLLRKQSEAAENEDYFAGLDL